MSNIDTWFEIVSNNDIHAYNNVSSRDLALCFNFIQVPDTGTIALTLTIMKNRLKKNSLDPKSFARVMSMVESSLMDAYWDSDRSGIEGEHYQNVKSKLSTQWYIKLCCHRVFFIPEDGLFNVISHLFSQEKMSLIKSSGIEEVAVYVNTERYDFNGKFY